MTHQEIKHFDRQQIFDSKWVNYHSETIKLFNMYCIEEFGEDLEAFYDAGMGRLENMLYGIWDGYLYKSVIANSRILPQPLFARIMDTAEHIMGSVELKIWIYEIILQESGAE